MSGIENLLNEQQRDQLRALIKEHGDKIYSFAMTLTGNEIEASDLTAEAFAKTLKSFNRYDPARPFESWVFKIAQNIYFDRKRRLKTKPTISLNDRREPSSDGWTMGDALNDGKSPLDSQLEKNETQEMVRRTLETIPPPFKEPLMLCDLLDMSYERIADTLKLPIGTVRSRIFRGRQIFKKTIEPYLKKGEKPWTATKP